MRLTKLTSKPIFWIGLIVTFTIIVLVLFLAFQPNHGESSRLTSESSSLAEVPNTEQLVAEHEHRTDDVRANFVDDSWSIVWKNCGVAEFSSPIEDIDTVRTFIKDLELSQECIDALESQILFANPFTRYGATSVGYLEFSLVHLNYPMTYERIFLNPEGDLTRVLEALARSECLMNDSTATKWGLTDFYEVRSGADSTSVENLGALSAHTEESTKVKWELKDSCNADAFANYAAFYDACYRETAFGYFLNMQTSFMGRELTSEQTSSIWKGYLSQRWVDKKCQEFNSSLELSAENFPEKYPLLLQIGTLRGASRINDRYLAGSSLDKNTLYYTLLAFGAQFGDEAASFAYSARYYWHKQPWRPFLEKLKEFKKPNPERLLATLELVSALERNEIAFDLEWLVDRICTIDPSIVDDEGAQEEHFSCRSLISDIYLNPVEISSQDLQTLTKIERVAIELNVYE